MAITTAANPGMEVQTAAKSSRLNASTNGAATVLGSQSGANSDEVIVPNAIGTNNEGNLQASPTYVGRHFLLRPLTQLILGGGIAASAVVTAGGTGYSVNDTLTENTATGNDFRNRSTWNVDSVSGGVVTAVSLVTHGDYAVTPADPVATTVAPSGGTGCTLTVTYEDGEELAYITADASNTLTVHQDWTNPPLSGEDWAVSYYVEDLRTLTGFGFNAKTGTYEGARRVHVGDTSNTNFAFFAMAEGLGYEIDDVGGNTPGGCVVTDGGYFVCGYLLGTTPVNGTYIYGINNTDAEETLQIDDGGRIFLYDTTYVGQRADTYLTSVVDTGSSKRVANDCKFFRITNDMELYDWEVTNCKITASTAGSNLIAINSSSTINTVQLVNTQGFTSLDDATTEALRVVNCTFVGNTRHVTVHDDKSWTFVNPSGWVPNSTFINFQVDDLNQVDLAGAARYSVQDTSGTAINGAKLYIWDGVGGPGGSGADIIEEETTAGEGLAEVEIVRSRYTYPSSVFTTTDYGVIGLWGSGVYNYGESPFVGLLVPLQGDGVGGIDTPVTLATDNNIVEASQSQAITDGSGVTFTRETNSASLIAFTGGSGTLSVGNTVTGGTSTADGAVVEFASGDSTAGTIFLDTRDGNAFSGTESLSNGAGWTATLTASSEQRFRFHIDANSVTMQELYDYQAARHAEATATSEFLTVMTSLRCLDPYFIVAEGGDTFRTIRSQTNEGAYISNKGSGTISEFRDNANATYVPPVSRTLEVNGVTAGTSCSIYADGITGPLSEGVELMNTFADDTGTAQATFTGTVPQGVNLVARNSGRAAAAIADDNGSFVDETQNSNSFTTNDMNLLPATPVVNQDRYLFGADEQFTQLKLDVTTAGTGGFTITWQYWNGAWVSLSGVSDGTSSFSSTGENVVSWTLPGDWATTTVNGQGPFYYIRAAYTAGTVTITPLARKTTLDIIRYLPARQTGTITTAGLTVTPVWLVDNISTF